MTTRRMTMTGGACLCLIGLLGCSAAQGSGEAQASRFSSDRWPQELDVGHLADVQRDDAVLVAESGDRPSVLFEAAR